MRAASSTYAPPARAIEWIGSPAVASLHLYYYPSLLTDVTPGIRSGAATMTSASSHSDARHESPPRRLRGGGEGAGPHGPLPIRGATSGVAMLNAVLLARPGVRGPAARAPKPALRSSARLVSGYSS